MYGFGPSSLATLWPSVSHFANNVSSRITDEHIQVHWEDTDSCWSGILQAHFNFIEPSVLLLFLQGRRPPVWNFTFVQQAQLHAVTKWSALEEEEGSHTNPASSSLHFVFLVPSRR